MAASAASPAAGCTPVHSAVARTGPTTKVNSSVTDSKAAAVVISGDPCSRDAQRARTIGLICGAVAPAGTAATKSAHSGASRRAAAISAPDGEDVQERLRDQDRPLPEPVGEPAALRRQYGHGDAGRRRHRAGPAEGSGGVLDEQDDADGEHRVGLAGQEARQQKGPGSLGPQQLPVSGAPGGALGVPVPGVLVGPCGVGLGGRGFHGRAFLPPGSALRVTRRELSSRAGPG